MLRAGDHLICSKDVYAGTARLFNQIVSGYGIEIEYVDTSNLAAVEAAIRPTTKLVHIETPSNPLMVLTDIAGGQRDRPCARHRGQRGQYVSVAGAAKSAGAGRGHRDALDDQVPERPLGWAGRRADRLEAGAQGAFSVCAEGRGRSDVALRVLPGSARHQDAARSHPAARGEWPRGGGVSFHASQGEQAGLSGIEEPIRSTRWR